MKNILFISILALAISSCTPSVEGNGVVKREKRTVEDFREVSFGNAFEVFIRQGDASSLVVEADENLLEHIISESRGDELNIRTDANFVKYRELKLYITVRDLREIEVSGACDIKSEGLLRSADLDINISGAPEMDLELEAGKLDIEMSGAGDIVLKGRVEELRIESSGAGELDAGELMAVKGNIEVSGASQIDVFVTDDLQIEASGAAEITYKGTPKNLKQQAGGAAEIKSSSK